MADVTAAQLMQDFAARTGLSRGDRVPKRYLWTDAFAVCNELGRFVEHRDGEGLLRARTLVDQTHRVLGKHRPDDPRTGWLSGLDEEAGARHPTRGGLRIGKELPERSTGEPFDPRLEWERDGQYFHYLTKWMHALERMTDVTGDAVFHRWAVELAQAAYARFAMAASVDGTRGLYWKMSIDLSRPQVPSMGHHDALDGLLTFQHLQAADDDHVDIDLRPAIGDLAKCCAGQRWETDDPLGLGGLMIDAWRLTHLLANGDARDPGLLSEILTAAARGFDAFRHHGSLEHAAAKRLAFREFGLSLGLHAMGRLRAHLPQVLGGIAGAGDCGELVRGLARYERLATEIERFWQVPEHRESAAWQAHRDINEVMFATSLAPGGFLGDAP